MCVDNVCFAACTVVLASAFENTLFPTKLIAQTAIYKNLTLVLATPRRASTIYYVDRARVDLDCRGKDDDYPIYWRYLY